MSRYQSDTAPVGAVEILRRDHAQLIQLFVHYFASREGRQHHLIPCICDAVDRHLAMDAEIFFPNLAAAVGDERLTSIASAEYAAVKDFTKTLLCQKPGELALADSMCRLSTMVANHVGASEGEDGAFTRALRSNMDGAVVGSLLRRRQREWILKAT